MSVLAFWDTDASETVAMHLAALRPFMGMSADELRQGNTPGELVQAAARLAEAVRRWQCLEPLERVLRKHRTPQSQP